MIYKCPDNQVKCYYAAEQYTGGWCWRTPCGLCLYSYIGSDIQCGRKPVPFETKCELCQYRFVCLSSLPSPDYKLYETTPDNPFQLFDRDCETCKYVECGHNRNERHHLMLLTKEWACEIIRYARHKQNDRS